MNAHEQFLGFESACAEAFRRGYVTKSARFGARECPIRIAGHGCADVLLKPIAHLLDGPGNEEAPVGLRIDVFDSSETGVLCPGTAPHPREATQAFGRVEGSGDDRFIGCLRPHVRSWLDREAQRLIVCVEDHRLLGLDDRARPLLYPLLVWHADIGLPVIHAALVERHDRGILIAGSGGSGKSTAALASLRSRKTRYLGDDYVALQKRVDGSFTGHSLFSSAWIDADTRQRFPEVEGHVMSGSAAKRPILVGDVWPGQLGRRCGVVAILIPEITDQEGSTVLPARPRDSIVALAPTSIMKRPGSGQAAFRMLGDLSERVPAFNVSAGRDMRLLSDAVNGVLDALNRPTDG